MNKSNLTLVLNLGCLLLLTILLVKPSRNNTGDLGILLNQQTAVMNRALGKVIPIELPQTLTKTLEQLEARIADPKKWPTDSATADAMLAESRELVRQIPAWAEEDLLGRLNALCWDIQSIQLLRQAGSTIGTNLEVMVETLANQMALRPNTGSANITARLSKQQAETSAQLASYRLTSAIQEARLQLRSPLSGDPLDLWQRLSEWTNSPTHGTEVSTLRQELRSRILQQEVATINQSTRLHLDRLGRVQSANLRQAGYYRIMESVTVQRLRLLEEIEAPTTAVRDLETLSATIESKMKQESDAQRKADNDRLHGYQQWALREIASFRTDLTNALDQSISGKLLTDKTEYPKIAEAMKSHLLPISTGYLNQAVAILFGQAFQDGWIKLSGMKEKHFQTEVAEADAVVVKKTPQNYSE